MSTQTSKNKDIINIPNLKNAVIEILNSPEFKNAIGKPSPTRGKVAKFILALLIAIGSVGGIAGVYVSYKNSRNDHIQVNIKETIATKLAWQQKILYAANQLRLARADSLLDCKYVPRNKNIQKTQEYTRVHARFNLVIAATGAKTIFGNSYGAQIDKEINAYIKYDQSKYDVCDPGSPENDKPWLNYIIAIDLPMQSSIDQDRNKLDQ